MCLTCNASTSRYTSRNLRSSLSNVSGNSHCSSMLLEAGAHFLLDGIGGLDRVVNLHPQRYRLLHVRHHLVDNDITRKTSVRLDIDERKVRAPTTPVMIRMFTAQEATNHGLCDEPSKLQLTRANKMVHNQPHFHSYSSNTTYSLGVLSLLEGVGILCHHLSKPNIVSILFV